MNISAALKGRIIATVTKHVRDNPDLHIFFCFRHSGHLYSVIEVKYCVFHVYVDSGSYDRYVCTYRVDGDKAEFTISPRLISIHIPGVHNNENL